jgi:hypothetical protein
LEDAVKEVSKFGLAMNLAAVLFSRLQTPTAPDSRMGLLCCSAVLQKKLRTLDLFIFSKSFISAGNEAFQI